MRPKHDEQQGRYPHQQVGLGAARGGRKGRRGVGVLLAWLPALVLAIWAAGAVVLVLAAVLASVAIGIWRRNVRPALAEAH